MNSNRPSSRAGRVPADDQSIRVADKKRERRAPGEGQGRAKSVSPVPPDETADIPTTRAASPNVYSNAFNFTSYQDGRTDLRTGQFSAVVNLATIRPQGASDGSREIKLVFSALSNMNAGYGIGWRLSESQFDPNKRVLSLAGGETYTANPLPSVGNQLTFQDLKLKNVVAVLTDSSTITIYYIDGMIEVLRRPSLSGPYRTVELIFENGEKFTYSYTSAGTLERIVNTTMGKEALTIRCSFNALEKVRALGQGGKIVEISFTASNQLITSITIPYDNTSGAANPSTQPKYSYSYRTTQQGFQVISQITNPMGGVEKITYRDQELRYYNNSTYLPAAVICESIPGGGQPSVVKKYSYSTDRNFTGYPYNGGGFQEGRDNLYWVTGAYDYWGEETTLDANDAVIERVKTTFNKFHLMLKKETQRGNSLTTQDYTYNDDPLLSFPAQPANLQVPKQVITTFTASGASRRETITVESDAYGNALKKTEASGIRSEYEYYPIAGDGANCPAEPNGFFVRFCRQEKIIPADGGQFRTTQLTYTSVTRVQGSSYFVVEKTRSSSSGLVSTNQYTNNLAQPVVHGRIASTDVDLGGRRTSTQFTYTLTGTDLEQRRALRGHDGTVTSASRKFCTITQLLLQGSEAGEASLVFSYDVLGRVISQTAAPGTANAATNTYAYYFATTGPSALAKLEETDARGKRYVTRYDGKGRVVTAAELMTGGQERRIKAVVYDRLGNKVEETVYDQLEDKELALRTRYEYNGWNALARTVQPDGSVVLSERDMVANNLTTGIQGLNTTINQYNAFNKVAEVTQAPTSGPRLKTLDRRYDGFGRCISATNVAGHRTNYAYDAFDRISEIQMQPADGTSARTVRMSYANFSSADLATEIAVNGTVLGKRSYDGIGRMVSTANGQAAPLTYQYDSEATRPSSSTSPRGIRLSYRYNTDLGALTEVTSPNDGACRFTYNSVTAQMTDSSNSTANRQNTYDQYGYKQSERVTATGESSDSTYAFSPAGRPLRVTTTLGGTLVQQYDTVGRPQRSTGNGFTEDITYDAFGRVVSVRVSLAAITLDTAIAFDSFGREGTRTLRLQGSTLQTIHRSYSASGQLTERTTNDGPGNVLSRETFTYDAYSRLISFTCTGSRYPSDSRGRRLRSQTFSYDVLDNIIRADSGYVDGSSNTSTRSFSSVVPSQLVQIQETQPAASYTLTYDPDGNLVADSRGRTYSYDQFGRMSAASPGGSYGYDANGRLLAQTPPGAAALQFFYAHDLLAGQKQGQTSVSFHRDGDAVHGRTIRAGSTTRSEVYGLDTSNSVISRTSGASQTAEVMYTPYGESGINLGANPNDLAALPAIAFNGQHLDALANLYFLGNGKRAYSPELMIFLSPDPLAPFGKGGLNAYAYCGCDPINMIDPTGLLSSGGSLGLSIFGLLVAIVIFAFAVVAAIPTAGASLSLVALAGAIGAGLGVIGGTLGVAGAGVSFADEQNGWDRSSVANALGIASLAFGIASAVVGAVAAVGAGVTAAASRGSYSLTKALGGQVSDIVGASFMPGEAALATTTQKVGWGLAAGAKTFFGISESVLESAYTVAETVFGVTNFGLGVYGNVTGTIGVIESIGQQNATDGANGNGQGEIQLTSASSGDQIQGDPYKAAVTPTTDPIGSLEDLSVEFNQLGALVRRSMNQQLYYGESEES